MLKNDYQPYKLRNCYCQNDPLNQQLNTNDWATILFFDDAFKNIMWSLWQRQQESQGIESSYQELLDKLVKKGGNQNVYCLL